MAEQGIAKSNHWRTHPFPVGLTAKFPLSHKLDFNQLAEVKKGVIPKEMEDKWFVFYEGGKGPNSKEGQLYFHRSWTGFLIYKVTLIEDIKGGATVTEVEINSDPKKYRAQLEPRDEADKEGDEGCAALANWSFGVDTGGSGSMHSIPEIGRVMDMINWVGGPGEKLSYGGMINNYLRGQGQGGQTEKEGKLDKNPKAE